MNANVSGHSMPHQCVQCSAFYPDGSNEIIHGCVCGHKLFFYVKPGKEELFGEAHIPLTSRDRAQIERDVYALIGAEIEKNKPVVLDLESIRIAAPGKYEIDLLQLLDHEQPLVFRLEDGKYAIDLAATFERLGKR